MDPVALQRWKRTDRIFDNLALFVGVLMIIYLATAVFGLVSSSVRHYSTFVLFVMVISCFASFKVFIGERLGKKFGEEGYEEEGAPPGDNRTSTQSGEYLRKPSSTQFFQTPE